MDRAIVTGGAEQADDALALTEIVDPYQVRAVGEYTERM